MLLVYLVWENSQGGQRDWCGRCLRVDLVLCVADFFFVRGFGSDVLPSSGVIGPNIVVVTNE